MTEAGDAPARVVVAPDSLKGTLPAAEVAAAFADGWRSARPHDDVVLRPMANGGEGTLQAFATASLGAERVPVTVTGPIGHAVSAAWLRVPEGDGTVTAAVELASTSGIELVPEVTGLQPLDASSIRFGQAIADALAHRVDRLVLTIGSSASSDGGAEMMHALGARIVDIDGTEVVPGARELACRSGPTYCLSRER